MQFELVDPSLNCKNILLEGSFLVLELRDLCLQPRCLGLLVRVVPLDLLLNAMQLVGECLACIILLHGQD